MKALFLVMALQTSGAWAADIDAAAYGAKGDGTVARCSAIAPPARFCDSSRECP